MLVWPMCEWYGYNVRPGASEHGMCECEYADVRVIGYVRVTMC